MAVTCPNCGKQLPDYAEFCDFCGTRIPAKRTSSSDTVNVRTRPSSRNEVRAAQTGKRSFAGTMVKLVFTAVLLAGLFFGGMWLWNKLHYNPALDGPVYPGTGSYSTETLTPSSQGTDQKESDVPADQPSVQEEEPVINNESHDFNDVSKLRFEDFDDFYRQITYEGTPADRVHLPLGNANGVWKYDLRFQEGSSGTAYFDELGFAEMSVRNNDDPPVQIVLHPRLANDGYETWSESDEEIGYEPFGGGFDENDDIKLSGNNCVLLLKEYYAHEGREYLIAELWVSEESHADFLMMRGQE